MKLSIIIPVYNELATLSQLIEIVQKIQLPEGITKEIIVVDDGSTDGAVQLLQKDGRNIEVMEIVVHKQNLGKGEAIKTGLAKATGDYILIQDADLELNPKEYKNLLKPIIDNGAEVVYGSRFSSIHNNNISFKTLLTNRLLAAVTNFFYGSNLTDEATAYKLIAKKIFDKINIESKGFEICPEITAKILRNNKIIYEVPISYIPRNKTEGKKLRYFRDGLKAILTLLKYRLKPKVEKL